MNVFRTVCLFANCLTPIAALASAVFAYLAFVEAYRQANTADGQLRPWIKVISLSPISLDHTYPFTLAHSLNVQVENVGHSPAVYVKVRSRLQLTYTERANDIEFQRSFCAASDADDKLPGQVVFPNESKSVFSNGGRQPEEITTNSMRNGNASSGPISLELVGCVLYLSSFKGEVVHKTSFFATVYADQAEKKQAIDVWKSTSVVKLFPHLENYNGTFAE